VAFQDFALEGLDLGRRPIDYSSLHQFQCGLAHFYFSEFLLNGNILSLKTVLGQSFDPTPSFSYLAKARNYGLGSTLSSSGQVVLHYLH